MSRLDGALVWVRGFRLDMVLNTAGSFQIWFPGQATAGSRCADAATQSKHYATGGRSAAAAFHAICFVWMSSLRTWIARATRGSSRLFKRCGEPSCQETAG